MATATVAGGAVVKAVSGHGAVAALSPSELAAANQALASLNLAGTQRTAAAPSLLTGSGNDTFAGAVAGAQRFLPAFNSDTVGGGLAASSTAKATLASTAGIPLAGATAAGVQGKDVVPATGATQVITLNDQTTIHLIGVNNQVAPKA